jgi:outer membrane receptor protein involved in Fe transport
MRRILVAVALLALAPPLWAQRTTGGISGTVKDGTGAALPGVTVAVSGPNVVGSQTTTTNEQGFYRLLSIPPGVYQVTFSIAGFKTVSHKDVHVDVGATVEQGASLEISQLQETLEVIGEAAVVDTTSNEVGANYDRNWVENAPLRRFSFLDLVAAAPGSQQVDSTGMSGRTMVYGSSYDENSFQLDGVDITENFFNEFSAEPNTDAIEQVEVLSLGAPAEYGNLTGAVYNIVTRQGTNEFHGDLNYFHQSDGLTSSNTKDLKNPDGTFVDACATDADPNQRCAFKRDRYRDFTAQIGGPIFKDKLWFFASFQYQRDSFGSVGVDTSNPLAFIRDSADRYLFKLNWQVNPKHKLVANFHYDDKATDNGLGVNSAPTTAWTRRSNTPTPGLAYTGVLSDKTVLDLRYSGFYGEVTGGPTDPNQPRDLTRFVDLDTSSISGGHYYWYDVQPRRTTVTGKVSHLADNFLSSSHDFRFGVQYSDAVAQGLYGFNDIVYSYTYYGYQYGYGYERRPFSYSGNTRNIGVFADDTVRVNDRVSFNIGVRYDHNKAFSAEQQELDELAQPTGVRFPKTDLFTWKSWSPRVGFNLKLTADGRTVLKGHWGRYHRSIATGEFANVVGPNVKPTFSGTYNFATGSFENPTLSSDNTNLSIDPNYKSPRTDQYILSLERELKKSLGVSVNYVHKEGRDYPAWRDVAGEYAQVPVVDNFGDNPTGRTIQIFQLVSDPGARRFQITNPPGVESTVDAVSFDILKRMTGKWQLNASATWLRSTGRLTDSVGSVTLEQRGGLQFRRFGRNPNDFVNTDGRLTGDVTWAFKVQAIYQLPAGFLLSANFSNHDGAHRVRRVSVRDDPDPQIPEGTVILLQKRGEIGRLPDVTLLDMRLQKDFKLGEKVRFSVFADALNLLNSDTWEGVQSSTVTSSAFNLPDEVVDPRRFMLGAKLRF